MRYEIGDRVKIKSLDWYNENKDEYGYVWCIDFLFTPEHSKYCGCEFTISHITEFEIPSYVMENNGLEWTDDMIEGLVEEEVFFKANDVYNEEYSKGEYCHEQSFKWGFQEGYNYSHENDKLEISLKEGYQFKDENGNVINATKIVLEKKKKEYPKTFRECCEVLGYSGNYNMILTTDVDNKLFNALYKLKVCRDAYWKIAGEEMGLGKPWSPSGNEDCFVISRSCGEVYLYGSAGDCEPFEFPTEEMRDAFYENFKEEIEQCKELL